MEVATTSKIKDYYRGAQVAGRLIAECESFEELDKALQKEYELETYPGSSETTEAQKAIMEIRKKLHDLAEEGEING